MGTTLHHIDGDNLSEFAIRVRTNKTCPFHVVYGEPNDQPAQGNYHAVQFEHPCAMGASEHDVHAFTALLPGTDEAFMVLWGTSQDVITVYQELEESAAREARIRG